MPWKGENDPYKIWLSEIILQQTRVAQGLPYYLNFVKNYPTVKMLAEARDEEVYKLWEGLGYYSRCRNLLKGARQIVNDFNGTFPRNYESILSLSGVGPYTAAAIASFAFGLPYAVVDGNVIRVLARFFCIDTPFDITEGKKLFANYAQQLMDTQQPAAYNQAIMDFGATICKPAEPNCSHCPLQQHCSGFKANKIHLLPVKSKKILKKTRSFYYLVFTSGNHILINKREEKDIWQNLHEFYLIENNQAFHWDDSEIESAVAGFYDSEFLIKKKSRIFKQQLTHQTIFARFIEIQARTKKNIPGGFQWINEKELQKLAFPQIINSYLAKNAEAPFLLF